MQIITSMYKTEKGIPDNFPLPIFTKDIRIFDYKEKKESVYLAMMPIEEITHNTNLSLLIKYLPIGFTHIIRVGNIEYTIFKKSYTEDNQL